MIELLANSTVKFIDQNGELIGSGFFVTENQILTAAHNFEPGDNIRIVHPFTNAAFFCKKIDKNVDLDYALVEVDYQSDQICFLGKSYKSGNKLMVYGYSEENSDGEAATVEIEGNTQQSNGVRKVKVKNGNIQHGLSGALVFNQNSAEVIGLMIETRNSNTTLGGYFTLISDLFDGKNSLWCKNVEWHFKNKEWYQARHNFLNDEFDETNSKTHFNIFQYDADDVEKILIEPNYELINYDGKIFNGARCHNLIIDECLALLKSQSVLYIIGSYGAGKSLVSKCVQKALIRNRTNTLFIKANNIDPNRRYHTFLKYLSKKLERNRDTCLILDTFDELSSPTPVDASIAFFLKMW